jgi:TPR repeat protein
MINRRRVEGKEGTVIEGKESKVRRRATPTPQVDSSDSENDDNDLVPPPIIRRRATPTPQVESDSSEEDEDAEDNIDLDASYTIVPPRRKQHREIRAAVARNRAAVDENKAAEERRHEEIRNTLFAKQAERDKAKTKADKAKAEMQRITAAAAAAAAAAATTTTAPLSPGPPLPSRPPRRGDSNLSTTAAVSGQALPNHSTTTTTSSAGETKGSIINVPATNNDRSFDDDTASVGTADTAGDIALSADVDELLILAKDCSRDCSSLVKGKNKKVKTLPELLQALNALVLDLDLHGDNLSDFTISNSTTVAANLQNLLHVLHETSALLSRISGSRRFNSIDMPGVHSLNRKFRNKVSRASRDVDNCKHALVTSLIMAMRTDLDTTATSSMLISANSTSNNQEHERRRTDDRLSTESLQKRNRGRGRRSHKKGAERALHAAEDKCMLADRFFSGLGVDRNLRLAHRNYLLAAEAGLVRAMNSVGCMYVRGIGVSVSAETAQEWFQRSSDDSDPEGMFHLGTLLDDRVAMTRRRLLTHTKAKDESFRTGVVRTMRYIEKLWKDASELGHSGAMNALGSLYEHADPVGTAGVTRDLSKALHWYTRSAELDNAVAQNNVGSFCYVGKPPMKGPNYTKAREWFERAAEQSDPVGLNNLGICYELGRGGVAQDLARASTLYAQSAAQGNPSAMNNWGFMLVKRAEASGSAADSAAFRRAALLFRCAVQTDGGWPEAEDGDGMMDGAHLSTADFSHMFGGAGSGSSSAYQSHSSHSSHSSSMSASERRHRRTELKQTNADACFNLATLYEAGYGVERDLQAAYS